VNPSLSGCSQTQYTHHHTRAQANWLKGNGVRKGDAVLIYMPMVRMMGLWGRRRAAAAEEQLLHSHWKRRVRVQSLAVTQGS